jgi:hypothetical protein
MTVKKPIQTVADKLNRARAEISTLRSVLADAERRLAEVAEMLEAVAEVCSKL